MVTTRSRSNKQATAAALPPAEPSSSAPTTTPPKRHKRKSSTVSTEDSSMPATKLLKTDLTLLEELPTPVTQPLQPPLETAAPPPTPVDDMTANAVVAYLTATPLNSFYMDPDKVTPAVAPVFAPVGENTRSPTDITMTTTAPKVSPTFLVAPSTATMTMIDTSALDYVKEPTPDSLPLPEVATVLTQPLTTVIVPMVSAPTAITTAGYDHTTTANVLSPAPTAPQLSSIPALAPTPAPVSVSVSAPADPLTTYIVPENGAIAAAFSFDKPLPATPLETPATENMRVVDPTGLLFAPTGLPVGSSTMITAPPASTLGLGVKNVGGKAANIALISNDIQPHYMPQQQLNGPGNISSVVSGIDAATAAAVKATSANARGPKQSSV
ncbi:hypothetical protein BGZ65_007426 [Modicella reniformis]|uniref:Uncharacterized protein n=1 Tax=Modicella reniformis TaxID=1440133 RepID=A0A9P6LXD2_9FUNG|nr:hypothetical protein BGZ65_007426 [Modicella reniformis]